jgi:plasmid stabilization system protein ParE
MRCVVSPAARQDLIEIVDYIAADNPDAALRVEDAILAGFDHLASEPGLGHTRSDLTTLPVRFFTVMRRYSIVYRTGDPATVEIVRVLGPGRDAANLLG